MKRTDFAPEAATEDDARAWAEDARNQLAAAFDILRAKTDWSNEDEARRIARLVDQRERLMQLVDSLAMQGAGTPRIRSPLRHRSSLRAASSWRCRPSSRGRMIRSTRRS